MAAIAGPQPQLKMSGRSRNPIGLRQFGMPTLRQYAALRHGPPYLREAALPSVQRYSPAVADPDVERLLASYREILVEMHANRIESGSKPRRWNQLVRKMQAVHLQLRETEDGRAGITALATRDENETVRAWSATNALAWAPERVRPIIEAQAASKGLDGLDATMILREYDAGRLDTGWVPQRR